MLKRRPLVKTEPLAHHVSPSTCLSDVSQEGFAAAQVERQYPFLAGNMCSQAVNATAFRTLVHDESANHRRMPVRRQITPCHRDVLFLFYIQAFYAKKPA
jgi:hypothetical protein